MPRLRETTTGEWAQALTNNVYQLGKGEEKNKWNNSLYRHRVRFEGLKPNRIYDYTVKLDNGGATYSNTFRTAPDSGKKWTFPKQNKKASPDPNPTAMKLAWTAKTGVVKGSFSIVDGAGKKQKFTMNGIVVDGVAYGTAFNKKLGMYLPFVAE